jgi:hypothetical protein
LLPSLTQVTRRPADEDQLQERLLPSLVDMSASDTPASRLGTPPQLATAPHTVQGLLAPQLV